MTEGKDSSLWYFLTRPNQNWPPARKVKDMTPLSQFPDLDERFGWDARLIPIKNKNTGGVTGWCLEIHDLVAGKYVSGREKYLEFIRLAIDARMVKQDILMERVKALRVDASRKEQIRVRATEDFQRSSRTPI